MLLWYFLGLLRRIIFLVRCQLQCSTPLRWSICKFFSNLQHPHRLLGTFHTIPDWQLVWAQTLPCGVGIRHRWTKSSIDKFVVISIRPASLQIRKALFRVRLQLVEQLARFRGLLWCRVLQWSRVPSLRRRLGLPLLKSSLLLILDRPPEYSCEDLVSDGILCENQIDLRVIGAPGRYNRRADF